MPKDLSRKADKAPARFVTMENMKSRGQHFLANPLIIQVRENRCLQRDLENVQSDSALPPL